MTAVIRREHPQPYGTHHKILRASQGTLKSGGTNCCALRFLLAPYIWAGSAPYRNDFVAAYRSTALPAMFLPTPDGILSPPRWRPPGTNSVGVGEGYSIERTFSLDEST